MSEKHVYGLDEIVEENNRFPFWLIIVYLGLLSWGFYYLSTFWTMETAHDLSRKIVVNTPVKLNNPYKVSMSNLLNKGKEVYMANCAGCHGDNGGGADAEDTLLNFRDGYRYGESHQAIKKITAWGIPENGMPPYHDSLTAHELEAVVTYVESFNNKKVVTKVKEEEAHQDSQDEAATLNAHE